MSLILKRIIEKVEEDRGIDGVKPEDTLENLGLSSIDVAHLEVKVEASFGISQPDSWANASDRIEIIAKRFERIYEREITKNRN
jgi:acyl carrier protein